jgi:hypothetical protein
MFSLVSTCRAVAPVPVISIPKFAAGVASQDCASEVTSTKVKILATVVGTVAKAAPTLGAVLKVTPSSVQEDVTGAKLSDPAAVILFV